MWNWAGNVQADLGGVGDVETEEGFLAVAKLYPLSSSSQFPVFAGRNKWWKEWQEQLNNDPLEQTHSPVSSDRYIHLKIVLCFAS